jgi:putative spermidine/putrescine transport system substrate-binding protein
MTDRMTSLRVAGTAVGASALLAISAVGVSAQDAETPVCDAVEVGTAVIRCENFYEDYWPIIDAQLDALYEEARNTDGGKLVIWDWYPRSDEEIAAFNARFPDIDVETQGFEFQLSDAIITADQTGQRNTDVVSGSITSMTSMYDQGYWADIDWTDYGVPAEFTAPWGYSELLPDSFNSPLLVSNVNEAETVPTKLEDFDAPEWEGNLGVASWLGQNFTGYGMAHGEEAMTGLIQSLLDDGVLLISDEAGTLVSSGDIAVNFGGQLFSDNPNLALQGFEDANAYAQFSGVNAKATNPAAATLWNLWYSYDPDWLTTRLTDPAFATSAMPYPGLPSSLFEQATGLAKTNIDAYSQVLESPTTTFETAENRDEFNALIDAANGIFYSQ